MNKDEIKKLIEETIQDRISSLSDKLSILDSLYKNGSLDLKGIIRIIGGQLQLGGGATVSGNPNETSAPLVIFDDPGATSRRIGGMGILTVNKGLLSEQMNLILPIEQVGIVTPTPGSLVGTNTAPLPQGVNSINLAELVVAHSPYDSGYGTFFYGIRMPVYSGTLSGRITNGGTTLTDLSQSWATNELAGATLDVTGSTGEETFLIASNTANSITITGGTWASASGAYTYSVSRPIYLGAANAPWRRLYVQNDIRFGIGATDGAYPTTGAVSFRLIKESARALSCEAAFGSKTQATTVGAAFTLTWTSGHHILTGTAARTSDTTTAITDGAFSGQVLILQGTSDVNTITIKQNANTRLAGGADVVLGANDTLMLIWNGTDWIQVATSNNT